MIKLTAMAFVALALMLLCDPARTAIPALSQGIENSYLEQDNEIQQVAKKEKAEKKSSTKKRTKKSTKSRAPKESRKEKQERKKEEKMKESVGKGLEDAAKSLVEGLFN